MDIVENAPKGGLLVILVDGPSGYVVWAGAAVAEIQENPDAATVKARLDYAVTQMLKKLPKLQMPKEGTMKPPYLFAVVLIHPWIKRKSPCSPAQCLPSWSSLPDKSMCPIIM